MKTVKVYKTKIKRRVKGKTVADWVLRWSDTEGNTRSESLDRTDRMTTAEAEDKRLEKELALSTGQAPQNRLEETTLSSLLAFHLEQMANRIRSSTLLNHTKSIEHAISALGHDARIDKLNRSDIAKIEAWMLAEFQDSTVHKHMGILKAMFKQAVEWKMLHTSPMEAYKPISVEEKDIQTYSDDEIKAMLAECEARGNYRMYAIIRTLRDSGIRRDELMNLRWDQVTFGDNPAITIQPRASETIAHGAGKLTLPRFRLKAKASRRSVPVLSRTIDALSRLRMQSDGSLYVFTTMKRLQAIQGLLTAHGEFKAGRYLGEFLAASLHPIQDAAGIKRGTIKQFRSTYCSAMANAGVPLHVLKQYAGHAKVETTDAFYLKVEDSSANEMRRAMAATA